VKKESIYQPIRTCIGCGTKRFKHELLRIVRTQPDKIAIDPEARKPGRGAYLCYNPACVEHAFKRKSFERKLNVAAGPELKTALLKFLNERA
jgi:predicted RNA-binding protein YlxR (DUF448 family)